MSPDSAALAKALVVDERMPLLELEWGRGYHNLWFRTTKADDTMNLGAVGSCIEFAYDPGRYWICIDTYKYTGTFIQARKQEDNGTLRIEYPTTFRDSLELFGEQREAIVALPDGEVSALHYSRGRFTEFAGI